MRVSRLTAVLLLSVSWLPALPAGAAVYINEFARGAINDQVEIYNSGPGSVDLTGWFLRNEVNDIQTLAGTLGEDDHTSISKPNFVAEGGEIQLVDGALPVDIVSFGYLGGAPLPPQIAGYSCARYSDGTSTGDDAADWTLDASSTFNAPNDPPAPNLGGQPTNANEIGQDPGGPAPFAAAAGCSTIAPAVEFYNSGVSSQSLTGWWITDGNVVHTLSGSVSPGGYLVVTSFPPGFCFEDTGVLYLFDAADVRVDQWGIAPTTIPSNAVSWQRVADGAGPKDGYNYATSGGGSTMFIVTETFGGPNPPSPPGGVPTLSEWAMILLAGILLLTGVRAARKAGGTHAGA
jgi:hypothetical protein